MLKSQMSFLFHTELFNIEVQDCLADNALTFGFCILEYLPEKLSIEFLMSLTEKDNCK